MHVSLFVRTHEAPGVGADEGSGHFFVFQSGFPGSGASAPVVWSII